ncbi:hypothetical protein RND81_11G060100 [Saponaria officinalis]|uniref:Uncharacterized protein n=1 Tax=Saponaria officinalis TaxID=3572 RepID=A0AAW1HIJ3_SAPOF
MGRPRKTPTPKVNEAPPLASEDHHRVTAQPTRIGRGGRVLRSTRGGARGGRRGGFIGGRRSGRGRGQAPPQGVGVLFDEQGNGFTHVVGSSTGRRSILDGHEVNVTEPSTQLSVNQ